jgi:hypothetical protein
MMRKKVDTSSRWRRNAASLGCYAVLLLMGDAAVAAATPVQIDCQHAWQALGNQAPGSDALLAAWKDNEARCKGTGIYEIQLASIYSDRNEFDQARQALLSSTIPDNLKKQAAIAGITIDYLQAVSTGDHTRLSAVEKSSETFTRANPAAIEVLSMLGHTRVLLGEDEQAIGPLGPLFNPGAACWVISGT